VVVASLSNDARGGLGGRMARVQERDESGTSWVTSLRFAAGQYHRERDAAAVEDQVVAGSDGRSM
jgi:hypothetical protein